MKFRPFDLLTPLTVSMPDLPEPPTLELDKRAVELEQDRNSFTSVIGVEPDPTLVKLDTLESPEVVQEADPDVMYSNPNNLALLEIMERRTIVKPSTLPLIEEVPSSILDSAMGLVEPKPAGTTAADIPLVAVKFDEGKRDWSLLPVEATEEIIKVLEFGAKKYDRNNWAKGNGFLWTRPFNAMLRHLWAWLRGEDNDPESGLSHIAHAGCNVLFLLTFILNKERYNQDDRNV